MKQTSIGSKLWILMITLGVLAYFGFQGLRYWNDPLATTMAYTYQVENGGQFSGYVVRQEEVLPDESSGLLRLERKEGERVSKGGIVAVVYANQDAYDRQTEIDRLDKRVDQLEYAQESMLGAEASLKLDSQIMQSILRYRRAVASDRLETAEDEGQELRSLVLKRDYTYSGTEDFSSEISALQAERKKLSNQSASAVRNIRSQASGLYSAVVDGYESVLTVDSLSELTPSALSAVQSSGVGSNVGKLIFGDCWYYAAVMDSKDAETLKERTAELERQGKNLLLRFTKNIDRDLPVTISRISEPENGRCIVVLKGSTYLQELTLLRQQSAQIIYEIVEGIRVPNAALRLDIHAEEDGTQSRTIGVYCVVGAKAAFKPVEVIYSDKEFTLVRAASENEKLRIRPGDEVIVAAKNLFHGKVVQ